MWNHIVTGWQYYHMLLSPFFMSMADIQPSKPVLPVHSFQDIMCLFRHIKLGKKKKKLWGGYLFNWRVWESLMTFPRMSGCKMPKEEKIEFNSTDRSLLWVLKLLLVPLLLILNLVWNERKMEGQDHWWFDITVPPCHNPLGTAPISMLFTLDAVEHTWGAVTSFWGLHPTVIANNEQHFPPANSPQTALEDGKCRSEILDNHHHWS